MKAGILGGGRRGIGSRLLAALAMGAGWVSPMLSGNNAQPVQRVYGNHRPTGAALRDPRDFHQSNRLEAAQTKRDRKAEKLHRQANYSADQNRAHYDQFDNLHDRFNPFYINRETV
jgi:hypothetical protein